MDFLSQLIIYLGAAVVSLAALWLLKENDRLKERNLWLEAKTCTHTGPAGPDAIATIERKGRTLFLSLMPNFIKCGNNRVVAISPHGTRHQIRIRPERRKR